jgi:hypothetical protein
MTVDNALTPHADNGKPMPHSVDKKCGQMCTKKNLVIRAARFQAHDHGHVF